MDELYRPNLPKIHHNAGETKREEQELNGLNPQTDTDEIDEQISNGTNIEALEELLLHPNDEILVYCHKSDEGGDKYQQDK